MPTYTRLGQPAPLGSVGARIVWPAGAITGYDSSVIAARSAGGPWPLQHNAWSFLCGAARNAAGFGAPTLALGGVHHDRRGVRGERQMFAALDLASGEMFYRFRDRKRAREIGDFCRQLRAAAFPIGRLYLICDNYSAHQNAEATTWCADHDIGLVFTPTDASRWSVRAASTARCCCAPCSTATPAPLRRAAGEP